MYCKIYTCILLFSSLCAFGQIDSYDYKYELQGITEEWHKIDLPNEVINKLKKDFSDLRIYGVTANNDTIEAPYILRQLNDAVENQQVSFKRLNSTSNNKGYYFTMEIPTNEIINQIKLDFKQKNFDWTVKIEGSQDQLKWFEIVDNYRILSIKNNTTDYQFTTLNFSNSKYRYFRLLIDADEKPELSNVNISNLEIKKGHYIEYPQIKSDTHEDKDKKQTIVNIDLLKPVSISQLHIDIANQFDYYRPFTISYLSDSTHTDNGWQYSYRQLSSGVINSLNQNTFKFNSTIARKLKLTIHNHDNQVLTIDSIQLKGCVHQLVGRFTEPASYSLAYGNKKGRKPNYDIVRFTNKIPETLRAAELGELNITKKADIKTSQPLFKSKLWLWGIMGVIIFILGWFTLNMMKNVEK